MCTVQPQWCCSAWLHGLHAVFSVHCRYTVWSLQCIGSVCAVYLQSRKLNYVNELDRKWWAQCMHSAHCILQCFYSVRTVFTAGTLHALDCVSTVCTAPHCSCTALRSGFLIYQHHLTLPSSVQWRVVLVTTVPKVSPVHRPLVYSKACDMSHS